MKTNVFCSNLLDDPVVKSAEAVRVPRLSRARRWEQIRIRRVVFVFFHKKFHCVLWEKNCSDGIRCFRCADDQLSVLPRDAFVDREGTVLNVQVLPRKASSSPRRSPVVSSRYIGARIPCSFAALKYGPINASGRMFISLRVFFGIMHFFAGFARINFSSTACSNALFSTT